MTEMELQLINSPSRLSFSRDVAIMLLFLFYELRHIQHQRD